ncbi:PadR family transcriptional regulator [Parvibaculum sp.]|uniref:PadR family transcriptional regulator n=1 Tax=Parvibaculum sp. TaxID=2024848 RepID=UPI000EEC0EF3|nr:PadR family transcriptional regulator [Parvibaculum sp.]MBO6666485.1 PadR family transcriptional regulator [Parvibaculum sp.]MBO6690920.1 PadR family transcriptional regulator [Parvibaculum sp.]MBO6713106.1 PadR family transcriptional regulator [Parvibaculum sp.]HAC57330.1 PadR family transcriptional regulator [Rhodobiaceae bacterium]
MQVTTLCLGALVFGDATGYEINKMFEDGPFSHFLDASYGSIYPALTRLTDEGLVTCKAEPQERRPDKKIYSLTEKGRLKLRDALQQPIADDKFRSEFLFTLLFAHLLPRDRVRGMVDARLAAMKKKLAELAHPDEEDTPGMDFARQYGHAVYSASIDFLENNRHLIEEIATEEEAHV